MNIGKILIVIGCLGVVGVFLAKGFTNSERWTVAIFCLFISLFGVLVNSKMRHLFTEQVFREID